jgi:hypothetical protein
VNIMLPVEDTDSLIDFGGIPREEMFAIAYSGPATAQTSLLQFVWREVLADHPGELLPRPVVGTMNTTGGTYQLTTATPPAEPNYNTDATPGRPTPFYEGTGINTRSAEATTIYDLPYNAIDKVEEAFANGAERVVSRAHFLTFAVRHVPQPIPGVKDLFVTGVVALRVEWVFDKATDDPKRTVTAEAAPVGNMLGPAPLRARFKAQYPLWDARMTP